MGTLLYSLHKCRKCSNIANHIWKMAQKNRFKQYYSLSRQKDAPCLKITSCNRKSCESFSAAGFKNFERSAMRIIQISVKQFPVTSSGSDKGHVAVRTNSEIAVVVRAHLQLRNRFFKRLVEILNEVVNIFNSNRNSYQIVTNP